MRDTPLRSVYRIYEYMCTHRHSQVQYETEYFFFHSESAKWSFDTLPDPKDDDEQHYAFVASIVEALVAAFNWRLSMGIRRDRSNWSFDQVEDNPPLKIIAPRWAISVPPLREPPIALRNRTTTQDLDYFIHPTSYGPMKQQVQAELRRLIFDVAAQLYFVPDWANDQVRMFLTLLSDPTELFDRSIQQGLLLYDGATLQIYGVLWLWVLFRKMKRLQMENQPQREVDWIDCISITKRLTEENGVSVQRAALTEFDHTLIANPQYSQPLWMR
ncbi:MAG: hypothetical protein Q9192_008102 [Flavoplaca navasiana]